MRKLSSLQRGATRPCIEIHSLHPDRPNRTWRTHWPPGLQMEILSKLLTLHWLFYVALNFLHTIKGLCRNADFLPGHLNASFFHFILLRHEHQSNLSHYVWWSSFSGTAPHLLLHTQSWSARCHCKRSRTLPWLFHLLLRRYHGGNLRFKAPQYGENNEHGERKAARRHARRNTDFIKERETGDVLQQSRWEAPHSVLGCD